MLNLRGRIRFLCEVDPISSFFSLRDISIREQQIDSASYDIKPIEENNGGNKDSISPIFQWKTDFECGKS